MQQLQVLQQMGPTTDKQTSDTQIKQTKNKQTTQITQKKNKQKTREDQDEDEGRVQLGIVGSGSAPEVKAWQDESMMFVELETACDLATTDPNAYSCKEKKYAIDHYTNFLWCKEHDQAHAIEDLEQLHAEKLAGAAL